LKDRESSVTWRDVRELWKDGYAIMTSAAEWAGPVGDVWAAEWERTDRSFAGLSPALDAAILAAAPGGPGRAVDLGCGAGATSIALAGARPDLAVTGVDVSAELVRVAAGRGAGLANLRFVQADVAAGAEAIAAGADLLCSRHGVMFYADPASVFAALRRGVAPGARLVFSCFRSPAENPWAGALVAAISGTVAAPPAGYAPGPFAFADPAWVGGLLTAAGWSVGEPRPVDYVYGAGEGEDPVADAAGFFRRVGPASAALRAAPDADRPAMLARLTAALAEYRVDGRVSFPAAAWIWSARA
jgi:SAM-dependent methyltransferase